MCSKVVKRRHVTRQNRAASPMSERTSPDTHVASSQCKRANVETNARMSTKQFDREYRIKSMCADVYMSSQVESCHNINNNNRKPIECALEASAADLT